MDHSGPDITRLLRSARKGDGEARERLFPVIYAELHRLARHSMHGQSKSHVLQATALVNEVYLRLMDGATVDIRDRGHFFNLAARSMRQILIDHARAAKDAKSAKHSGAVDLDALVDEYQRSGGDVLVLGEALERLAEFDPHLEQIVNLKFFAGLSMDEVAAALDRPLRTVERDWQIARMWLARELAR